MGSKDDIFHYSLLATGQSLLSTCPIFSESCSSLSLHSEELPPIESSVFVTRLPAFLSTVEFAELALQDDEPRFDILAFRCPSCDSEQQNDHARVAAADFLMNFPTHQICLSKTDHDNVPLQQETDTTDVSNFPFHLFPQLSLDFLLSFCHVASNTLLRCLQMLLTLFLTPLKFCRCFTDQTFLWFSTASPATTFISSTNFTW